LLVIEIKIPHIEGPVTSAIVLKELNNKWPDLVAFLLSFVVIGQFWTSHHRFFGHVIDYTPKLMWLNLLMLLWVVLMPFSTYLIMEYGNIDIIWLWYSSNLALISLSLYFLWKYIGKNPRLSFMSDDKLFMQHAYTRALIVTIIFLAGGLMALIPLDFFRMISRFIFFLIFPILKLLKNKFAKKALNKKPS
jgi:uncharacterized membrane protein